VESAKARKEPRSTENLAPSGNPAHRPAMRVYPAIDLRKGRVVRLRQGDAKAETVYFHDPVEPAQAWKALGVEWIHVVDLDGAFEGKPGNLEPIRAIAACGMKLQLGGGLRTDEDVRNALNAGASRVVLGTKAATDTHFVEDMVREHGDAIAIGIDARDGKVAVRGWVDTTGRDALSMARDMADLGVGTIIYTDISRDGMLTGPNFDAQERLCREVDCRIIASGGVAQPSDIERFRELGEDLPNLDGVIVGKAIYDGRVELAEVM